MANSEQQNGNGKSWKLLVAALLFALMAGVAAVIYLKVLERRLEARLKPPPREMTQVVVAKRDLSPGTKVDASTMAIRKVPKEYVNSDVITPANFDSVNGAVLVKPLEHGKMLTQDYIDLNIPKDFAGTIQTGHRAMTIQVDEVNAISGMIRPGNRIDLYTRISARALQQGGGSSSGEVVIPVLENILVLATDQKTARPNEDEFRHLRARNRNQTYNTLTLEVTPKQAALITLAETRGSLVATLRNSRETGGVLFDKVSLADLYTHSTRLLHQAMSKLANRTVDGVTRNARGQLVTRDGTVITDPNVHLNDKGLLVTNNGTILSGRGLTVGRDGKIRTRDGRLVDTASLVAGKNGTLIDKHGTVVSANGYRTLKGGFLMDKDGNILTHNGQIISGVHVAKDGTVRTEDGRILNANQLLVDKKGRVHLVTDDAGGLSIDKDGVVRDSRGRPVPAKDLVTVAKDGTVRAKDGTILKGVHVGKDGKLYSADGKPLSAADILQREALAKQGDHLDKTGNIVDAQGNPVSAKDLVTVAKDGTVRTKDGTVLEGVHVGKDGKLYSADGKPLSAADILQREALAATPTRKDEILKGVTATPAKDFTAALTARGQVRTDDQTGPYEVEYIIGGSANGVATTFQVQVEEMGNEEITPSGKPGK